MLSTFFSGSMTLLHAAPWVLFLVVPLLSLDNYVKRRNAAKLAMDRESLSRFG